MRILLLSTWILLCTQSAQAEGLSLEDLVGEALRSNPQVISAIKKWDAAKARVASSWNLENPHFMYEIMGEMVQTRVGPQEQKYAVSQKIPFPSKIPLRVRIAQKAEERAAHGVLHTKQMVRTEVTKAYADLLSLQEQIVILREEKTSLEQIAAHIRSRVATGGKAAKDAAKVEAEIAKITERLLSLRDMRVAAEERLNIALNVREKKPWPHLAVPELPTLQFDLEALKLFALEHRHMLIIQELLVEEQKARHELAQAEYLPDVSIGFNYIAVGDGTSTHPDDGQDVWGVPITVSIPLWEPQIRGRVDEARASAEAAAADLAETRNETDSLVIEQYTRYMSASERIAVYEKTWIPQARQALSGAVAGLESGEEDILGVLDSVRMVLEAKLGYWRSFADTLSSHALIEQAVGFPLDQIEHVKSHRDHLASGKP